MQSPPVGLAKPSPPWRAACVVLPLQSTVNNLTIAIAPNPLLSSRVSAALAGGPAAVGEEGDGDKGDFLVRSLLGFDKAVGFTCLNLTPCRLSLFHLSIAGGVSIQWCVQTGHAVFLS